ncbi:MAG: precorrin-4 C(11)-methyltransferase [Bacteroidaceae bacterium]|nr:precorrin-4 C(11)-methyltransferase [Bacteroidaceae bacterium]
MQITPQTTLVALVPISEASARIAETLQREFRATVITRAEVAERWNDFGAFIFIGAMGICVRTIAPLVEDKHTDPAVLCIDSTGANIIPVLSGHVGGANRFAQALADRIGARAIITTQSDLAGLWALDCLDQQFGWYKLAGYDENKVIYAFVNRRPVALILGVRDEGTDYLESTCPDHVVIFEEDEWRPELAVDYEAMVVVSFRGHDFMSNLPTIFYIPRVLSVGIGLAHQAEPAKIIWSEIYGDFSGHQRLLTKAIREFATIDLKADEPVVKLLQEEEGYPVTFYTAEQLAAVSVPTPSQTVADHVGTPSVCEAAALLASDQGHLLVTKQKGQQWTYAVAIDPRHLRRLPASGRATSKREGHIEIVGAGPGDPDLISVRGRRFLEQADLILYAGSLVPEALTRCHKPGAVVRSSADMALEEQCALMQQHYDLGHLIVRLHTGDPCIFGAIQEQMAFFDANGMHYHITPGISSFLAAAAELRSQFTIPERTQTIILTRGEGRTPMPEREKLHLLARSRSTMCIFLSAAIVDDVQRELLQEYPEDTPVAACYHLTWPDQRIYRGQLKDLADIVHDNNLTLTTMLVVGEAIDNRTGLSELYNRHFTHLFRQGE